MDLDFPNHPLSLPIEVRCVGWSEAKLDAMLGYMDKFDFWFNIVTP